MVILMLKWKVVASLEIAVAIVLIMVPLMTSKMMVVKIVVVYDKTVLLAFFMLL